MPRLGVPCKHLAAVFYLLAERFDDDPFQILAWRGRDRNDLLARLDAATSAADDAEAAVPLTELLDVFYRSGGRATPRPSVTTGASLLDQLPPVSLAVRGRPLTEALRPAYAAMTRSPHTSDTPAG